MREPVSWWNRQGTESSPTGANCRGGSEREIGDAAWQCASDGAARERPRFPARPATSDQNARVAAAERGAGSLAGAAARGSAGSQFVEISRLADTAGIWTTVWSGRIRFAGGEGLAQFARIHVAESEQRKNVDRIQWHFVADSECLPHRDASPVDKQRRALDRKSVV